MPIGQFCNPLKLIHKILENLIFAMCLLNYRAVLQAIA
jgi:hypothetical protein